MREDLNIPYKTGRVLNLILLSFMLIFLRVWYLSFVQGDYHRHQSLKPQRRTLIEKVERSTIRDRFNIPLAQNKIEYSVAVRYADIREIPSNKWEIDPDTRKKVKKPVRGPYIGELANLLGKELTMDPQEIEDIIYAKASLFPHTPFIIKNSLSEKQYYKLRLLQKDWVGIVTQRGSKRVYPLGKTACDVVGYMGPISKTKYLEIAEEIALLQEYIQKRESGELAFLPEGYDSPLEVRKRLQLLREQAYTINDCVGKLGIESSCDEQLRGIHGKKIEEIDPKGMTLRELPNGKKGVSGKRVFLSISSELQEFAEGLLAHHESLRDLKDSQGNRIPGTPWIKGGAAVAMNPKTGEILALASYPRFDPNDFVQSQDPFEKLEKQQSVRRWIENEKHIAEIWEGKTPLKKETFSFTSGWGEESASFHWDFFLDTILPPKNSARQALINIGTMRNAYLLQMHFERILTELDFKEPSAIIQTLYPQEPHIACKKGVSKDLLQFLQNKLQTSLENLHPSLSFIHSYLSPITHNDDKLLVLDLVRLLMVTDHWTPKVLSEIGALSLSNFFSLSQSFSCIQEAIKDKTKELYHHLDFQNWRSTNFKNFLKKKRKEEKEQKTYARPYTEYLEKLENTFFIDFWNTHKYALLDTVIQGKPRIFSEEFPELTPYLEALSRLNNPSLSIHLKRLQSVFSNLSSADVLYALQTIRTFDELDRPLYGKYRLLRHNKGIQLEKHLAASFYPLTGFGYCRSQAFRQSTPQGSLFKLVVAYEALKERYNYLKENLLSLKELNPLTLTDFLRTDMSGPKQILGQTENGEIIRRVYKGALLPRSSHTGIGKVDLLQAIEQSSNIYFSILAAEHIADPSLLEKTARDFGLATKTGIELQGEIPGTLPNDLADNKTGLYAFAIGQHSLIVTPLQTTLMLAAMGNNGHVVKPQIIGLKAGKSRFEDPLLFNPEESYSFQEALSLAGIYFPLFTESLKSSYTPYIEETEPETIRSLAFPKEVKQMLFEGMRRVVTGQRGTAKPSIIRYLKDNPSAANNYIQMQNQLFGKTGTAEISYKQWLDSESKGKIHNHIWFGGLLYPPDSDPIEEEAELAVVVYLRFSIAGGKEAAPLAVQIASKWREIQKKQGGSSYLEKTLP